MLGTAGHSIYLEWLLIPLDTIYGITSMQDLVVADEKPQGKSKAH